jgi:septum formation protein
MKEVILGSHSPRRVEIMNFFSLPFRQVASNFDEDSIAYSGDPALLAKQLALAKAETLARDYTNDVIVTADTVVAIDGIVLGKPANEAESREMLNRLCGRWHSVFTGVASYNAGNYFCETVETKVLCVSATPDEIHRYMNVHALYDKAGGYAIQKSGSILVEQIVGCYYNVLGLPITGLRRALKAAGIDLWDYIKELE